MRREFEDWFYDRTIHGVAFEEEFYHCGRFECGTIGWNAALDTMEENLTAANTGSLPLCRSCIKLYACTDAGDIMQACGKHEKYAAKQQAGA